MACPIIKYLHKFKVIFSKKLIFEKINENLLKKLDI